jgi:hypothetical protein
MAATKEVTWWSYRRRRWLAGFGVALCAALAWGFFGETAAEVVLYNNSSRPLGPVRMEVGGVTVEFAPLAPEESAVRALPAGAGGELGIWLPGEPPQRTAGPWVEPSETAQVVVRVDEFGRLLFSQLPSWRSRLAAALR